MGWQAVVSSWEWLGRLVIKLQLSVTNPERPELPRILKEMLNPFLPAPAPPPPCPWPPEAAGESRPTG